MTQANDIAFYSALLQRHQYAFVDRVFTSEKMLEGMPIIPLVPKELRSDAEQMPALLPLGQGAPYMSRLAAMMKAGEEDPSCNPVDTLIVVTPDIEQSRLESHLISRLICLSPKRGKVYLRYFSSDVFPHLLRVFSPAHLKSLFGPHGEVREWTYRFQNDWITVPAPYVTEDVLPLAWVVTKGQLEALTIVGDVSRVLDTYQERIGRPWNSHAEWDAKARVAEISIGIAQNVCCLRDPIDLKTFALHALTYGERFYRHPSIENILRDTASRPGAYHAATSKLTKNEWATVAARDL